jgi:hypothetical protein
VKRGCALSRSELLWFEEIKDIQEHKQEEDKEGVEDNKAKIFR